MPQLGEEVGHVMAAAAQPIVTTAKVTGDGSSPGNIDAVGHAAAFSHPEELVERVPRSGRPPHGFGAGADISPTLNIFAPTASSTRALRTRKRLGP